MVALLIPVFFCFLSLCYRGSRVRALMDGTVLLFALAVVVAEVTSLFTAYTLLWVSLCWGGGAVLVALLLYLYRVRGTLNPFKGMPLTLPRSLRPTEKLLLLLIAGTVAAALVRVALSPPTIPSDATVYHQPRAFMFYKNQSIHNFACSTGHMLYFGPLNAILFSQLQILCFGWDGLSPLVQFSAYLLCMAAVYQTSLQLCKSRTYALIGCAFVCFLTMAHLQASTMQSDLLVTALCAVALSDMAQVYGELTEGGQPDARRFALLGLTCGLAVLAKLSAGATLIGLALLFALLLWRKQRRRFVRSLFLVLLCAVLMTGGYWARNAQDWNGDFLPVSYAGSRPDYQSLGVRGTALIAAKALANTLTDPTKGTVSAFQGMGAVSLACANAAADCLGLELNDPRTREGSCMFTGWCHPTPDQTSYPFHGLMVLLLLPAAVLYALIRRKGWLLGYALCCVQAILLTSTQYLWNASYNRYLMPGFVLAFPLCAYILQRLTRRARWTKALTALLLAGMFAVNAMVSGYFLLKFSKDVFAEGHTQDERVLAEHEYHPLTLWRGVLADVEENGYTKIGLGPGAQGDYIWMRPFADARFTVKYIYAEIRPDLEDATYVPDCLIMTLRTETVSPAMTYHGATYEQRLDPAPAFGRLAEDTTRFVYYVRVE